MRKKSGAVRKVGNVREEGGSVGWRVGGVWAELDPGNWRE